MFYRNASTITKKFHGVEFKPGDIKECKEFINDALMVKVDKPKEQPVNKSASKAQKSEPKAEVEQKAEDASKQN